MEFKNLFKIEKDKRNIIVTSSILAAALAMGIVAGVQFKQFSDYQKNALVILIKGDLNYYVVQI